MKNIRHIVKKEFLQLKRNKQMLPIIFGLPLIQLILLVNAATFELRDVNIYLVDQDKSAASRELINKFTASSYFKISGEGQSIELAKEAMDKNEVRMILIVPNKFERNFVSGTPNNLQILIDAVDGSAAGIIQSYAMGIIKNFGKNISAQYRDSGGLVINDRYWYNELLDYKFYMAPGILAILVTMIVMFLASMNIVREKEIGTIEQLNVTPIKKSEFILGKLIPFWIIGMLELSFGLVLIKLFYQVPFEGNLVLLFAMTALFLIVVLSLGLLISTVTNTQQQAMFIAWFIMVLFLLMSGLFTPIDSMPKWAKFITEFNPITHFIYILRGILLKGSEFADLMKQFWILSAFAVSLMVLSTLRYKKVH